ncbi:hypothetical protein [Rubinisphaera italica]|nr:hypothetical protein [Rubinisphaera italica]
MIRVIEQNEFPQTTNVEGIAVINMKFNTSASHKNPKSSASTSRYSVLVSASNYGTVISPLRYQSTASDQMKEEGKMIFQIGLWPNE